VAIDSTDTLLLRIVLLTSQENENEERIMKKRIARVGFKSVTIILLSIISTTVLGAQKWFGCTPNATASISTERIHILCKEAAVNNQVRYFAAPTRTVDERAMANRHLTIALMAITTGRRVDVLFDEQPTEGQEGWGCSISDCRVLLGVSIQP
jgi:hypothetical protein